MIIKFGEHLSGDFPRRLFNGIQAYAFANGELRLTLIDPRIIGPESEQEIDGYIGQSAHQLRDVAGMGVPCINVSSNAVEGIPQVCNDNFRICEMIVTHFRERNFRTLAMLIDSHSMVSTPRKEAFIAACEAQGFVPRFLEFHSFHLGSAFREFLRENLTLLPQPAGLVLSQDRYGPMIYDLCKELQIDVPRDLAMVGINNAVNYTVSAPPELSSVDNNAERIGFEAASSLVRLIKGEIVPDVTLIPPKELILRASSDITVHLNPNLGQALDYIRRNFHEDIELEDIVRQQKLGRRALEKHFQAHFRESPMKYLRSLRLEKARSLLETTSLSVKDISFNCGIQDNNYFSRIFRQAYKTTPLTYRRRYRQTTD